MKNKKYVVLENLTLPHRGFRFWSTNSENNTHSDKGELWYKEILFTDDEKEAISASQFINKKSIATHDELEVYYREEIKERNECTQQDK